VGRQPDYPCLRLSRTQTASGTQSTAIDEFGAPIFRSVLMQCAGTKYRQQRRDGGGSGDLWFGFEWQQRCLHADTDQPVHQRCDRNGRDAVRRLDAERSDIQRHRADARELFERTTYIGAVKDASDTWYQG
jgi:hypothetical protein